MPKPNILSSGRALSRLSNADKFSRFFDPNTAPAWLACPRTGCGKMRAKGSRERRNLASTDEWGTTSQIAALQHFFLRS